MNFFTSRKPAFLNFALLLLFLAGWLMSYLLPALKGLVEEEHLFYGTVTHASIPSIFGGSDIPFFDKTLFQLNGDNRATFILYASKDMIEGMSDWYSFASVDAGVTPLEVRAARVDERTFVVHSISSMEGEMDFDDLVMNYQVYYAFIGCCIVGGMVLLGLVLLILWLVKKRRV